jgi:xylulose-5-phosphate/fructose-6-phosphate phosphoketolase
VLARKTDADVGAFLESQGYEARFVEGDEPRSVHQAVASALDWCFDRIAEIQGDARESRKPSAPARWPVLVLRTPKGWTGPEVLDGLPIEGTFRSHQVPLPRARSSAEELAMLEQWLRSYEPESLFDDDGRFFPELAALAPRGDKRMGSSPHANGGRLLVDLDLPDFRRYAIDVPRPAVVVRESTRQLGEMLRDTFGANRDAANFRLFCPDETNSNRLSAVFDVEQRCFVERRV